MPGSPAATSPGAAQAQPSGDQRDDLRGGRREVAQARAEVGHDRDRRTDDDEQEQAEDRDDVTARDGSRSRWVMIAETQRLVVIAVSRPIAGRDDGDERSRPAVWDQATTTPTDSTMDAIAGRPTSAAATRPIGQLAVRDGEGGEATRVERRVGAEGEERHDRPEHDARRRRRAG